MRVVMRVAVPGAAITPGAFPRRVARARDNQAADRARPDRAEPKYKSGSSAARARGRARDRAQDRARGIRRRNPRACIANT